MNRHSFRPTSFALLLCAAVGCGHDVCPKRACIQSPLSIGAITDAVSGQPLAAVQFLGADGTRLTAQCASTADSASPLDGGSAATPCTRWQIDGVALRASAGADPQSRVSVLAAGHATGSFTVTAQGDGCTGACCCGTVELEPSVTTLALAPDAS